MNSTLRAYLELHTAVILYGFTAILGKLISLSALNLVWWRVLIASLSLLFFVNLKKLRHQLSRTQLLRFMGIGTVVAIHWVTFYGAIKLANASVALVCFATTSLFTAFLEPLVLRQKIKPIEIGLGLLVIPGMILIVANLDTAMIVGFWVGIVSAFLAALFSSLNKKYVDTTDSYSITFLELSSAWLFLCLVLPFYLQAEGFAALLPSTTDWLYLLLLALLCTTLAFTLALRALKHLSAFASNLTINLEPVYGIFMAWIILKENTELKPVFYLGVFIILLAVFSHPFLNKQFRAGE